MARPQKETVDYFPHYAYQGKTMLILQNEFGNDGYAFWYRLLELLCKSENQVYDYNNPAAWRLLLAETHVKEDTAIGILRVLSDVDAIDRELNKQKLIWVQNLVDNLDLVYNRRSTGKPQKPNLTNYTEVNIKPLNTNNNLINVDNNNINVNKSTQTIQNNTKQYNTILLQVFDHWNSQNIIIHKCLNGNESTIKTALKNHTLEEINLAISTYSEIIKDEKYFFKFKWTLKEFLKRGLEKFINPEVAKQNYLKDKNSGGNGHGINQGNNPQVMAKFGPQQPKHDLSTWEN